MNTEDLKFRLRYVKKFKGAGLFIPVSADFGNWQSSVKIPAMRASFRLRPNTSDAQTFRQVFLEEQYRTDWDLHPKVIVDAGANIGCASVYFAMCYPEAKIIALEPELTNFDLLCTNCRPYPNIHPIRAALWSKDSHVNVANPSAAHFEFRVEETNAESAIPAMSMGQILELPEVASSLNNARLDLLKIDIEGAEREVFSAADLAWLERVEIIMIELHDRRSPGSSLAFYRAITAHNFEQATMGETIAVRLS